MSDEITYVTKPYIPSTKKYQRYVEKVLDSGWLTNNGVLVKELETRLSEYLGVKNLILVSSGTVALQVLYKLLGLTGEVITTPFSFVATSSSLVWEGIQPIFSDIERNSFNLNPGLIESKINKKTSALLPVHIYGNPCDIEEIEYIANKYGLKVIYDAAHAFGVNYKNESVLNYGNASVLSFHATKLFHTLEGGAIVTNDDEVAKRARLLINFGITSQTTVEDIGINAKMNELQAAMGLCVLDDIEIITNKRKKIWKNYYNSLHGELCFQEFNKFALNNYGYAPVLFESEDRLLKAFNKLKSKNILPRRYFYPSLDKYDVFVGQKYNPIADDISKRILCLPIYPGLNENVQNVIIQDLKECL